MRKFDYGSEIRVTLSADEVATFGRTWPCANLPARGYSFTFDKRNGDLLDYAPQSTHADERAVLALSQDAQAYAGV